MIRVHPSQSLSVPHAAHPVRGAILEPHGRARRWVWNWALARWRDTYAATGKSIALKQLSAELTALKDKPETAWLKEIDSQALQQVLKDLHRAFTNFFEKRARYPRFKSRKRDPLRFRIPQRVTVKDGKVYVPKIGRVRIRQSQPVEGATKSATFRRDACGHWYLTLVVEFEMPDVALAAPDPSEVAGIDLGLKVSPPSLGESPCLTLGSFVRANASSSEPRGPSPAAREVAAVRPRPAAGSLAFTARSPTREETFSIS